jgi:predicted DNA-binding transcriptional regulator AlpA
VAPVEHQPETDRRRRPKSDSPTVPIPERLVWDLENIAAMTGVSTRHLQRLRAAGRMPKPSVTLGRRVLWSSQVIRKWLDSGGAC